MQPEHQLESDNSFIQTQVAHAVMPLKDAAQPGNLTCLIRFRRFLINM